MKFIRDENETDDQYVDRIFNYYREHGFPHFVFDEDKLLHDFKVTKKYLSNTDMITKDGIIKQSMHMLGAINGLFTHMKSVQVHNKLTMIDVFEDDTMFKHAIRRRLKYNFELTENRVRKGLQRYPKTQGVSNFRPTSAYGIYDRYLPKDNQSYIVYDPCAGYGGRYTGASLHDSIDMYIGRDVDTRNLNSINTLSTYLHTLALLYDNDEDMIPIQYHKLIKVIFTSPPYFNTEKYQPDNPKQCHNRFDNNKAWMEGYMSNLLDESKMILKQSGGVLALNVADVKSYPTLCADLLILANMKGFKHIETLKLALSAITNGGFKYEPVFVFKL